MSQAAEPFESPLGTTGMMRLRPPVDPVGITIVVPAVPPGPAAHSRNIKTPAKFGWGSRCVV